MLRSIGSMTFLALLLVGCGGGGGSDPATYRVGGTVTGLSGSGLVLQDSGGAVLTITASGAFTFPTPLVSGANYSITVRSSPASPPQVCQVTNGAGTINAANVTNVDVSCSSSNTVRVTVSGLQGSGLVLQFYAPGRPGHDVGPPLPITSNGSSVVESPVGPGFLYAAISKQPASPDQACRATGRIDLQAPSSDVWVACSQYVYVTNAADNTISTYVADAASGALTAVGSPVATGTSPHAIADGGYIYVANEGSNDISMFSVDFLSGALTPAPGSPAAAGTDPKALAGGYSCLYVANAGSDTISAFSTSTVSGALTPVPPDYATGKGPSSIVLAGQFLYVANNGGSNDISAFLVDAVTCALTALPESPFPAGGNPLSLAHDAGPGHLYTANPDATHPSISGFSIDPNTGALTPLSGSPFPVPVSHGIATDLPGAHLYVTSGAAIVGYAIDATSGALTALPGFPIDAGANAYSITIDPSDQFLYVANDGAASISGFKLDTTTGALTPIASSPFPAGNDPQFITTPF